MYSPRQIRDQAAVKIVCFSRPNDIEERHDEFFTQQSHGVSFQDTECVIDLGQTFPKTGRKKLDNTDVRPSHKRI